MTANETDALTVNTLTAHYRKTTVITLPNNQGTISYGGTNTFTLDQGSLVETIAGLRHTDTSNQSGTTATDTDGVVFDWDDTQTSGDWFNYNVIDPTTGVRTQVIAGDTETDTEHDDENDTIVETTTPAVANPDPRQRCPILINSRTRHADEPVDLTILAAGSVVQVPRNSAFAEDRLKFWP